MDFLEELIIMNNMIQLRKITTEMNLNEEETQLFIAKYNKENNRLFTPCKKYMVDEYKETLDKYNKSD